MLYPKTRIDRISLKKCALQEPQEAYASDADI